MPKGIALENLAVYSLALAEETRAVLVGGVEVRLAGVGLGLDGLGPLHPVGGAHSLRTYCSCRSCSHSLRA